MSYVEPQEWRKVREKAIGALQLKQEQLLELTCCGTISGRAYVERNRRLERDIADLIRWGEMPNWVTQRRRRMPSADSVADYWQLRHPFFAADTPMCFRCNVPATAWGSLERAHLVNHGYGGLDHAGNIAMLCAACHRIMPNFDIDEWDLAAIWVVRGYSY